MQTCEWLKLCSSSHFENCSTVTERIVFSMEIYNKCKIEVINLFQMSKYYIPKSGTNCGPTGNVCSLHVK
jgi:hypothetical protein